MTTKTIMQLPAAGAAASTMLVEVVEDPSGVPISKYVTVAQILALVSGAGSVSRGLYSALPAAGVAGRVYFCTDAPLLFQDDGATWAAFQIGTPPLTQPPAVASLTAINAGGRTTTNTDSKRGIYMVATDGPNNTADYRILKKTAPVVSYVNTIHVIPNLWYGSFAGFGIALRKSSDGGIITYSVLNSTTPLVLIRQYSASNTGASPTYTQVAETLNASFAYFGANGLWLRTTDDLSATRTYQISFDGDHFETIKSEARTTGLVNDEVGIHIAPGLASGGSYGVKAAAWFNSWATV